MGREWATERKREGQCEKCVISFALSLFLLALALILRVLRCSGNHHLLASTLPNANTPFAEGDIVEPGRDIRRALGNPLPQGVAFNSHRPYSTKKVFYLKLSATKGSASPALFRRDWEKEENAPGVRRFSRATCNPGRVYLTLFRSVWSA